MDGLLDHVTGSVLSALATRNLPPSSVLDLISHHRDDYVRASAGADQVICLDDGRPMRCMTSHLRKRYGLTAAQYRARWGLDTDHPLIAHHTAARWKQAAVKCCLGRSVQA